MKDFFINNKLVISLVFIILLLAISLFATAFGMQNYEPVDFSLGIVNTEYLNMRSGAGINFKAIDLLNKNEYVRIFGKIGDWYIIQNEEDQIGTANIQYITPTNEEKAAVTNTEIVEEVSSINLTNDESTLLTLINEERKKNNLPELQIDENLYSDVSSILKYHSDIRHIRGGESTRKKFLEKNAN